MNTQQIIDVLVATYSANREEGKRAEATLDAARYAPGVPVSLLQICTIQEAPRDVRQSSALALKMACKRKRHGDLDAMGSRPEMMVVAS